MFIYHIGSVPSKKSFLCGPTSGVINLSLLLIFLTILWQWFVDNDPNAPGDLVLYRTIDPNQSDYVRLNGTLVVFQDQDSNGKNRHENILKVHAAILWCDTSILCWSEFDMKLSRSFSLWKCSHFFLWLAIWEGQLSVFDITLVILLSIIVIRNPLPPVFCLFFISQSELGYL